MRRSLFIVLLVTAACGVDSEYELSGEAEETLELDESALNANAILEYVNKASNLQLTTEPQIDFRAARGVISRRDGADALPGTPDDQPFKTIAELDAIPYIGPAALAKLDAWVTRNSGNVVVDGVLIAASQKALVLGLVNGADLAKVGVTATAYNNLVAGRPYTTVEQVGAVAYVGTATMQKLRDYVVTHSVVTPMGSCTGTGGSFDGIAFTKDEECHAVDFLNNARMSELRVLGDAARAYAYHPNITTLKTFADRASIGPTSLSQVKTAAATWTKNGLSYDTVANTWTHRSALLNGPVLMPNVYVVRTLPIVVDGGYRMSCAEVRDSPTSSNYLFACVPIVWNEYSCVNDDCWVGRVGTFVTTSGSLRSSQIPGSGGYRLGLSNGVGDASL